MNSNKNNAKLVRLQNVGWCPSIPASELKVGDVTVWNNGIPQEVLGVELRGKSVYVTYEINYYGKLSKPEMVIRRYNATKAIVIDKKSWERR